MRDILFRGKREDNGTWVLGDLLQNVDCLKIREQEKDIKHIAKSFVVLPETIGQYTGLTDKNGEKIFEGDILKIAKVSDSTGSYYYPPLNYPVNGSVKWDLCAWMWETLCKAKRYIGFPNAWCHYECEVIGNIHDNPELLKGATDERN